MSLSQKLLSVGLKTLSRSLSKSLSSKISKTPTEVLPIQEQHTINVETLPFTELVRDFLDPTEFFQAVHDVADINFICGVPDSLLKDFCACVSENISSTEHVIAANEGNAIAIAAGYHLATGRSPMVYMQNSGLGNAVNPLISLAAPEIYRFPVLLLIGWRGEPGKRDEPQHQLQGRLTPGLLAALGIPFQTLPDYMEGAQQALATAKYHLGNSHSAYALLVKRQTFLPYKPQRNLVEGRGDIKGAVLSRERAVQLVAEGVNRKGDKVAIVGSTGMASRELFEHRTASGQTHSTDFLCVGAMGHASSIAIGLALHSPKKMVYCLDGDGSVIMHMGALPVIGGMGHVPNFRHIVLNNGAHDSVGGQPTAAANLESCSLTKAALSCGYKDAKVATSEEEIIAGVEWLSSTTGPTMLEIRVKKGGRKNLGRPTKSPVQAKEEFMDQLNS